MHITLKQNNEIKNAINNRNFYRNEKVWTYFIASIIESSQYKDYYLSLFTSGNISFPSDMKLWFEAQPISPRKGNSGFSEGNTKLDLSFGNIEKRSGTDSGIQYKIEDNGWVCFIEAKLFSDCSNDTSYDPLRNQITRVIENLLCFQNNKVLPDKTYFSLLTPRIFKNNPTSKLYGYKYQEYQNSDMLKKDIQKALIEERNHNDWIYPLNFDKRIKSLPYNWVTYEEIIEKEYNFSGLDITDYQNVQKNSIIQKIKNQLLNF